MAAPGTVAGAPVWEPRVRSVLRIVAAFLFMLSGTSKLFGWPVPMPEGEPPLVLMSQIGIGAMLEFGGGALLVIGLFTRPVAFILSGMMAVAYFQFHFPGGFWPTANGGVPAVLYCFIFLYFSVAGAGSISVDAMRRK